jgi:uncharacterized protein YjbI with pentapeptide repeats
LERISHESGSDYWTVMETLTAFVREHARWKEPDASASEMAALYEDKRPSTTQTNHEPATDIAAVLSVIIRRDKNNRDREKIENWCFNLRGSDLTRALFMEAHLEEADLARAHLERADLGGAHLEGALLAVAHFERADLGGAHLERAILSGAHLEGANLGGAHLERANLGGAHLEGDKLYGGARLEEAHLGGAHLEGANLGGAHLEGANLNGAHLEGANLNGAHLEGVEGLALHQITRAYGDSGTTLPKELTPPEHWASGS